MIGLFIRFVFMAFAIAIWLVVEVIIPAVVLLVLLIVHAIRAIAVAIVRRQRKRALSVQAP
jgi:uncharacterized protein (DUF983 family)